MIYAGVTQSTTFQFATVAVVTDAVTQQRLKRAVPG